MKIARLSVRRVTGTMTTDAPLWEERLVRGPDGQIDVRKEQLRGMVESDATPRSDPKAPLSPEPHERVDQVLGPLEQSIPLVREDRNLIWIHVVRARRSPGSSNPGIGCGPSPARPHHLVDQLPNPAK